jgi:hypothetical protein
MTVARSVLALVACMVLLVPSGAVVQARALSGSLQGTADTHAPARFDIDEQPLATALRAFSEQSGIAVLFDDALVADRASRGIHGEARPPDALRELLVGSGLGARFSSMNAFTVTAGTTSAVPEETTPRTADIASSSPLDEGDAALIQAAIARALCARAATRPGSFRLAMQLWIDASGNVADAAALAPSGDPARDDRVLASVRSVRLPPRLARFSPVTILLVPSGAAADPCHGERAWEG